MKTISFSVLLLSLMGCTTTEQARENTVESKSLATESKPIVTESKQERPLTLEQESYTTINAYNPACSLLSSGFTALASSGESVERDGAQAVSARVVYKESHCEVNIHLLLDSTLIYEELEKEGMSKPIIQEFAASDQWQPSYNEFFKQEAVPNIVYIIERVAAMTNQPASYSGVVMNYDLHFDDPLLPPVKVSITKQDILDFLN